MFTKPNEESVITMKNISFQDIKELIDGWTKLDYIIPDDIPSIELYMDQVTTFMDSQLSGNKRHADDKILTKTMINNYSKNDLLPPSNKKKYSKDHIILLIYIFYLKNYLSIGDIEQLLAPMTNRYFDGSGEATMAQIYEHMFSLEQEYGIKIRDQIDDVYEMADQFSASDDYLKTFAMIAMLSYDIYTKKQLVEKMLDSIISEPVTKADAKASKEKAKTEKKKDTSANK